MESRRRSGSVIWLATAHIDLSENMNRWEEKLADWAKIQSIIDYDDDRDEGMEQAIAEVERVDIRLSMEHIN